MNDMEANSLVRGLIFCVQKTRSNIRESMGDLAEDLLADINPLLFSDKRGILPRLIEWQQTCEKNGVILGSDLFNLVTYIDRSESRALLGLLAIYGYTQVPEDGAPIEWFGKQWPYLSA